MWTRHRRSRPSPSGSRCSSRSVVVSGRSTWEHLPVMRMLPFTFRALEELELGPAWQAVFEEKWPHYKTWFLREGEAARPSYATSVRMLRAHMPELVPAYERVVELAGGGDLAARMLSLYKPPPYLAACSQGVWTRDGAPLLVRNYDYAPSRFEGVVWSTNLLQARDRDERLPVGAARRDERGRARRLAHVRRPPRARRRVRDPDRDALPARDVFHRRGDEGRVGPTAVLAQPQPDGGRRVRRRRHRLPVARPRADLPARSRSRRTIRGSSSGRSRRRRPGRSSGSRR